MAPAARVRVPGADLVGFDALMRWYRARRAEQGPLFRYDVAEVLAGQDHAAAILTLGNGHTSWRQVAVYDIRDGLIGAMSAYEDEPDA